MSKWVILAVGVLLAANGFYTRAFSFENETPNRHCFYMDLIGLNGCFHNTIAPMLIAWGPLLIGLALIAWHSSEDTGRRLKRAGGVEHG